MDGKTARGASSPAKPALHIPEPLSTTKAATSSSHILLVWVLVPKNKNKKNVDKQTVTNRTVKVVFYETDAGKVIIVRCINSWKAVWKIIARNVDISFTGFRRWKFLFYFSSIRRLSYFQLFTKTFYSGSLGTVLLEHSDSMSTSVRNNVKNVRVKVRG